MFAIRSGFPDCLLSLHSEQTIAVKGKSGQELGTCQPLNTEGDLTQWQESLQNSLLGVRHSKFYARAL